MDDLNGMRDSNQEFKFHSVIFKEYVKVARDWSSTEERFYFKLLYNSEIVKLIHQKENCLHMYSYAVML